MADTDYLVVLVADDFDEARQLLAEYLAAIAGFRVETAANGREAVELTKRIRPAIVIMDLAMPVMDGVEATAAIKADPETAEIPIVVLSAFNPTDVAPRRALELGAAEVLTKPCEPAYIEARIRHHCAVPVAALAPAPPDPLPGA